MKISETTSASPSVATRARRPRNGTAPAAAARDVLDTAAFAGVPEAELTPKVRAAIDMLMSEVQRMRRDLQRAEQRVAYLEQLADEDTLVPVYNRRAFVRELSRIVSYAERYGTPSSVLFFDLDGLKKINDGHGHAAGDAALKHIAGVLMHSVRESDIVGRLGGDEFGVILVHAGPAMAQEKAHALANAIAQSPLVWDGVSHALTVSLGTYTFNGNENVGEALDLADRAMYVQKQARPAAR